VFAIGAAVIVASVIVSFSVLSRYRSLASEAARSNELAKDLWNALDNKLKKQDERIVDLMARVEIYGVRSELKRLPSVSKPRDVLIEAVKPREVVINRVSAPSTNVDRTILEKLIEGPKTSTEIKTIIGKSREHTARLMKALFDRRYVIRNDAKRPFVYEITDLGRRYLAESRSAGT
jgi:hypothetical protein